MASPSLRSPTLVGATGSSNTAYGYSALAAAAQPFTPTTTGIQNTAVGAQTLTVSNGSYNTAIGAGALTSDLKSSFGVAVGVNALHNSIGQLQVNGTYSAYNTAVGGYSLFTNTTGIYNTALSYQSLYSNTTGSQNTALGATALLANTTGIANTAVGTPVMNANTIGIYNTAIGSGALYGNISGNYNAGLGQNALYANTTGSYNIGVGPGAGSSITTGSYNIDIGNIAVAGDSATIRIGNASDQSKTFVAGITGVNVTGGATVVVNASGQLGVAASSRRYKEDIQPMGSMSERLLKLRPVTFRYKQAEASGEKPLQYGLIAEEVAEVFPELVVYNTAGQPETVAYQLLASLLLNELEKDHAQLLEAKTQIANDHEELEVSRQELAALRSQATEVEALKAKMQTLERITLLLAQTTGLDPQALKAAVAHVAEPGSIAVAAK